jgi:ketosteroid isomerase-like protein
LTRPDYYGNPAGLTAEAEIVRAIYDAFARRDVEALLSYVSPDCDLDLRGTAQLAGRSEPYRGHDGVRQYFADVAEQWEELVLHAEDFRVIPGSVIVIGHVTGKREGLDVSRSSVWTWRVANGRATSVKVADLGDLAGAG